MHDDSPDNQRGSSTALALGILVGGVVGGSLALLLAPDSGRRTRERLRDLVAEARDRVEGPLGEAKAALSSAYEAGREVFYRTWEPEEQAQGTQPASSTDTPPSVPEGPVAVS